MKNVEIVNEDERSEWKGWTNLQVEETNERVREWGEQDNQGANR